MLASALALALLASSVGAQAAVSDGPSVTASDDAYTTSTRPTYNAGSKGKVAVGRDGSAEKVGYFKFELPSGEFHDPQLVLTVTGGSAGALQVHTTSSGWTDRGVTASNAPALGKKIGEVAVTGRAQTVKIPLDMKPDAGNAVSVAATRVDGGITRIASREKAGDVTAALSFQHETVSPGPGPAPGQQTETSLPIYVSPAPDAGSYIESFEERRAAGWSSAFYTYWPGDIRWNSEWADFVERHPEGVPVLGSPKGVDPASVRGFLDGLPQTWRDQWTMAYYQEPEDDFTTSAQRTEFRERVSEMADLVRPYGATNAVHLQEWTINPYNDKSWSGERALSEFFDVEDIDFISWSLYPAQGRSMREGIDRIKAFSEKYAPGVPWGITAAGSPVAGSAPIGGADRAERAQVVLDAAEYTAEVGGQSFGWFDFDEYQPGRDQLASKDPALAEALNTAAQLERTTP